MSRSAPRRVAILGAQSAIAEAFARRLAAEGAALALFGRDPTRLAGIADDLTIRGAAAAHAHPRDLTQAGDADEALRGAAAQLGGLDAVALFYGVLGEQDAAERDPSEVRRILEVNFTSAADWLMAAAGLMEAREERGGVVLAVSSVAGDRGRRSNYVYGAAKAGLSTLMQGVAHRFAKTGRARAVTVKLGFVDTPMTAGLAKGGPLWATPDQAAGAIARALDRGGPVVYAPWFWRWVMLAIRLTPAPLFNRVNL